MSTEKFSRYDSADYLKTEEDIAAYLEAVMEEGGDDTAYIARTRDMTISIQSGVEKHDPSRA